jgi:hypothetical protein
MEDDFVKEDGVVGSSHIEAKIDMIAEQSIDAAHPVPPLVH